MKAAAIAATLLLVVVLADASGLHDVQVTSMLRTRSFKSLKTAEAKRAPKPGKKKKKGKKGVVSSDDEEVLHNEMAPAEAKRAPKKGRKLKGVVSSDDEEVYRRSYTTRWPLPRQRGRPRKAGN